jgi:outer membrane immunogenic protein
MKKFLIATAALASVALVGPASAADLPVKAPPMVMPALYNWTGLYVGIEAGAVQGQRTELIDLFPHFFNPANVNADIGHPLHGGFVGGEIGFNWQAPGSRWVFGIEGDASWAELEEGIRHGGTLPGFVCGLNSPNDMACGAKVRDFETARIRIGYAFGPRGDFLAFVTAGWAGADMSSSAQIMGLSNCLVFPCVAGASQAPGSPAVVNSSTFDEWKRHNGFTVGMGAEYGITPNLSVKGEVLYVWLDRQSYCGNSPPGCNTFSTFPGPGGTVVFKDDTTLKADFIAARMALNYRFWWGKGKGPGPVVARY